MADTTVFGFLYPNPVNRNDRYAVSQLDVEMAPYAHDLAHVRLRGVLDTDPTTWTTGTPVHLQWGRSPNQIANFYGYILTTSRTWAQTSKVRLSQRPLEIWAIGASMPLRNGFTGSFTNQTGAAIATSVANQYRYSIDAPMTGFVWPSKNAAGTSAWSFLCDLAKQDGRICAMNGTQLRFYAPLTLLNRTTTQIPVFYDIDSGLGKTILEMRTDDTEMSAMPGQRKLSRQLAGLDGTTGAALAATSTGPANILAARSIAPILTELPADIVTRSQATAEARLAGLVEENRFHMRAKASLAGDVRVVQESPVVLEGLGARDSGLWQVVKVTHRMRWQYYALDCELGRDSDYDPGVRPLAAPVTMPTVTPPASVLINGLWQAATAA